VDQVAGIRNDGQVALRKLRSKLAAVIERDPRIVGKPTWCAAALDLFNVALAFEDLLRSDDFARIRPCGRCIWLFIDRGRGTGRRWCDIRTCGNRAKSEAFRAT
jgi:predicted RNA-binding Zn ribbon-like protein